MGVIHAYLSYDGALEVNSPVNTTGIRHLVYMVSGIELSALYLALFSAVLTFVSIFALSRRTKTTRLDLTLWIPLALLTFVSFHSYDFVVAAPLALLLFSDGYPRWLRLIFALSLLLIYRSANLASATGLFSPEILYNKGSLIDSIAASLMFTAFLVYLANSNRRPND